MFRLGLFSATVCGIFLPSVAMADVDPLASSGNNYVNLISGNLYEVTLTYTNSLFSFWNLNSQTVVGMSLGSPANLFTGGVTPHTGTPVDFSFYASGPSGKKDLTFSYGSYFGAPVSVSIQDAKISGTFGGSIASAPGPVAGAGFAGLAVAAASLLRLRRKKPV